MAASNAWTGLALSALLGSVATDTTQAAPGVIAGPGTPGLVTQTVSPSQSFILKEAAYVISGSSPGVNGSVLWTPGADITRALTAFHATLPRIDLVTAAITDPGSSSTPAQGDLVVQTGTAASSPVAPALTTGSLLLATLAIPAGVSSNLTNAMITDNRKFTGPRGGVWSVPDRAQVATLYNGVMIAEYNTGSLLFYNGTTWIPVPGVNTVLPDTRKGTFTITFSTGTASGTVTFPGGGFAGVPVVTVSASAITGNTPIVVSVTAVSATTFSWIARPYMGGSYSGAVTGYWTATY